MKFRRLLFFTFVLFPCCITAQDNAAFLLYKLYEAKSASNPFRAVEEIKKVKKETVTARIRSLSKSSIEEIIQKADAAASSPWTVLTWSQFNEFKLTGNRVNYENNYFSRRNKLTSLIIGELVSGDKRYLKEIVDGLGLICEESTWALPAHMGLQKAGSGLPNINEPVLDLFSAQTATILSYTKFLLGEELALYSPLLLQRIDLELKKRVFDPYLQRDDFWWMGFKTNRKMNNWNIFINTNVLSSALMAEADPRLRLPLIEKTIKSVDNFLRSYPSDGGCDEGPSYWGMAGGQLIEFVEMLSDYSGRLLDFSKNELIHHIGAYICKVHIDRNYYVNFADAAVTNVQDAGKIYKFGRLFNDKKLLQFSGYLRKINNVAESVDLGTIDGFISSLEIKDEFKTIEALAPNLGNSWLKDVQILTVRQEPGKAEGLFFAAKGGNNAESHNHNDVGNFVIYKDGTPLVVDAGVGVYTRKTFSADRYDLWYMQSDWHNCPTINGLMQRAGARHKATSVVNKTRGDITTLSMDIAAAYPQEAAVNSWKRTFAFNRQKGTVSLKEEYHLKEFKENTLLNFLVNGIVVSVKKGLLKLTSAKGKTIFLKYDPDKFEYDIQIRKIDDARLAGSWQNDLQRLTLKTKDRQLRGTHQIEFRN